MMDRLTYAGAGVDYGALDPFKRLAQAAGRATAPALARFGAAEVEWSRGESAYLIETPEAFLAHVEEGLGTKNLVADAMYRANGGTRSYYDHLAQDTVAMIVKSSVGMVVIGGAIGLVASVALARSMAGTSHAGSTTSTSGEPSAPTR